MTNSCGWNGAIPDGAIAAEHDTESGEFTGKFFFSEDEVDAYTGQHDIFTVWAVYQATLGVEPKYEKLFLNAYYAIKYAEEGAKEGDIRHIVKDLLHDAIEFEAGHILLTT